MTPRLTYPRLILTLALVASAALHAPLEHRADAGYSVLAVTGDSSPAPVGGALSTMSPASINDNGQTAFQAVLALGPGGVTAANDQTVWTIQGGTRTVLAREGVGSPPGVAGATFNAFPFVSIAASGVVSTRASLQVQGAVTSANNQGVWRLGVGGSLVARTGAGNVPDVAGASFEQLGAELLLAPANVLAINGKMLVSGGISTANDRGVWQVDAGGPSLLVREGVTNAPGLGELVFSSVVATATNDDSKVAVLAALSVGGEVSESNDLGIWRFGPDAEQIVARQGAGDVPGVPDASFNLFQPPTINGLGNLSYAADLELSAGVTPATSLGVWRHDDGLGALVARSGVGGVPDIPDANFALFESPLLNDAGTVVFEATLEVGPGGGAASDAAGLWTYGADNSLLAHTGSGGVPGVTNADFSDFGALAFNEQGLVAVKADLAIGPGGVSAANRQGIWLLDAEGGGTLVARTGSLFAGRTISALDFLGGSAGGDGRARSLNSRGQLVYKASFTNGDEALVLFTPASTADFDGDGDVDGARPSPLEDRIRRHRRPHARSGQRRRRRRR